MKPCWAAQLIEAKGGLPAPGKDGAHHLGRSFLMRHAPAVLGLTVAFIVSTSVSTAADQRYEVRLVANWSSIETFEFNRTSSNEVQTGKGTVTIKSAYSQNYQLSSNGGRVDFVKPLGPASSSVSAVVNGDATQKDGDESMQQSETFGSSYQNPNFDKPATGSGSANAGNLEDWAPNGEGLGFRFRTNATLKGQCTSSPAPHMCPPIVFQSSGLSDGGANNSSDAQVAPQLMTIAQSFDVTSGPAQPTLPALAQFAPFSGAKARGSLNQGYAFDFSGKRDSMLGTSKLSWQVSGTVRITVLNKVKK
jgi:hypothetical protein